MADVDPEGLKERGPVGVEQRGKGNFTSTGPNWVHSLDEISKSTFPLAVYGSIDTASRKILWLRIWVSHSNPKLIAVGILNTLWRPR